MTESVSKSSLESGKMILTNCFKKKKNLLWCRLGENLHFFRTENWLHPMICTGWYVVKVQNSEECCLPPLSWAAALQILTRVWLFSTPRTAIRQAPLPFTISRSLFILMSIEFRLIFISPLYFQILIWVVLKLGEKGEIFLSDAKGWLNGEQWAVQL